MRTSLPAHTLERTVASLQSANQDFAARYPGESGRRQPVHTVYGGAHLFKADTAQRLGARALRSLEQHAPSSVAFAKAIGLAGAEELPDALDENATFRSLLESNPEAVRRDHRPAWLAHTIYARVIEKLRREPVEDFRIDFEDGYGNRPDEEEDAHAEAAAREVARGMIEATLPPFIGIRIKPFNEELRQRSTRTLDIFLTTLAEAAGRLPEHFFVTLPKVTIPEQVSALVDIFDALETTLGLDSGALKMELMVETTQSIIDRHGRAALPVFHEAARGRLSGAHFGTYDYTASCQITAAHQHMLHPSCNFAKHMMQVAFGGTGVWLSDGATNIMPVRVHRATESAILTDEQENENRTTVQRAWRLHYEHVRHSLEGAFYQGWDLHPAQLPTRYAAVYSFFLESLEPASDRLHNFVEKAAKATLVGDVFDDAATGQGLLNYFLRALNSGALTEQEALELSGLTMDELRSGSFVKILKARQSL